jgi:hypothetical protein
MVHWRTILMRDRRRPAGFVEPCLPILHTDISVGPEWIHELKGDGYRVMATRRERRVRLWSRNGVDWASTFPRIASAIERLSLESVVMTEKRSACGRTGGQTSTEGDVWNWHVIRKR